MIALGCPAVTGGNLLEPVEEPEAETVTLRVGPSVRPPFFPLAFESDEPLQVETAKTCPLSPELPACDPVTSGERMMSRP